mmetsp:Transcript_60535/g.144239  ORF Transcript_60535/g.144239 Transcript_60535/m.144239 type:complete len:356 (-) Transcript_60535:68-1135(-)
MISEVFYQVPGSDVDSVRIRPMANIIAFKDAIRDRNPDLPPARFIKVYQSKQLFDEGTQALRGDKLVNTIEKNSYEDPLYIMYADQPAQPAAGSTDQQAGALKRKLEELLGTMADQRRDMADQRRDMADLKEAIQRGFVQYTIHVQAEIPADLLGGETHTVHASDISASSPGLTAFVRDQVIRTIDRDWEPLAGHNVDEAFQIACEDELKAAVMKTSYLGYVKVGNSNNMNVEATIMDPSGKFLILRGRVNALLVQNKDPQILQNMSKTALIKSTVLFVEIESGNKGVEMATLQLLATLKATAANLGMTRLHGVVINSDFSQATLVKFERDGCVQNGIFHPSQLGLVGTIVLQQH